MSQNPLNKMRSFKGKTNLEIEGSLLPNQNSCSNYLDSTNCVEKFNRFNCGSKESGKKSRTTLDKNQEQLSLSTQDKCQTYILESRLESNYKLPLSTQDKSHFFFVGKITSTLYLFQSKLMPAL